MAKRIFLISLLVFFTVTPCKHAHAAIPWAKIIKEAITRVVRAMDLLVQRR